VRIAWFNPFAGIAGDMALGALVDAGADLDAVAGACRLLGYDGWALHAERVDRAGIVATHVRVDVVTPQHHHRRAGDIIDTIRSAGLPDRARLRAEATFALLAVAEGALHGVAPPDVEFHEIGAIDSIVDIVGTAVALELLGIDRVASGPVAVGVGTIESAHGTLPNPAPAVLRVLEGAPLRGVDVPMELTTPTGAALLGALAEQYGAAPDLSVEASGYGAGTRNPAGRPNVVQVLVGTAADAPYRSVLPTVVGPPESRPTTGEIATDLAAVDLAGLPGALEDVVVIETNLDDVTAETLGYVLARLLDAGALDAWCTPVSMKKSRPGAVLSVLCPPGRTATLVALVARETGSLGVRIRPQQRWVAPRGVVTVDVGGEPVRVKVGPFGAKAEHDDAERAARRTGRPLREVTRAAEAQAAGAEDNRPHNERYDG
jgi:uncharacterized protein (TIGR00299 family) protein